MAADAFSQNGIKILNQILEVDKNFKPDVISYKKTDK